MNRSLMVLTLFSYPILSTDQRLVDIKQLKSELKKMLDQVDKVRTL